MTAPTTPCREAYKPFIPSPLSPHSLATPADFKRACKSGAVVRKVRAPLSPPQILMRQKAARAFRSIQPPRTPRTLHAPKSPGHTRPSHRAAASKELDAARPHITTQHLTAVVVEPGHDPLGLFHPFCPASIVADTEKQLLHLRQQAMLADTEYAYSSGPAQGAAAELFWRLSPARRTMALLAILCAIGVWAMLYTSRTQAVLTSTF